MERSITEQAREKNKHVSFLEKCMLHYQRFIGHTLVIFTYFAIWAWMYFYLGYRFPQVKELRREFAKIKGPSQQAFLICANHLTMIDSFLITWALGSNFSFVHNYKAFPWNLPEKKNFTGNLASRFLCFIGKCLPITRKGPVEETQKVFAKVFYLLGLGDTFMVFPEGTRSRSGLIEPKSGTYGVGKILQKRPETRVVCFYLRGAQQKRFSFFPKKNEVFTGAIKEIKPTSQKKGLRAMKELSEQIMHELFLMEREHFDKIK
ncbi:MAG: lysophospholipid acyltransferase family protein [Oligoflexales bacterium]